MFFDKEFLLEMAESYDIEVVEGNKNYIVEEDGSCRELNDKDIDYLFGNSSDFKLKNIEKNKLFDLNMNEFELGAA